MRISGASSTSWPRARRLAAVRSPSGSGRVTRRRTAKPPRSFRPHPPRVGVEEIGAGTRLELAAGILAERKGVGDGALTLRLECLAAVGLGDQPMKMQPAGADDGM